MTIYLYHMATSKQYNSADNTDAWTSLYT